MNRSTHFVGIVGVVLLLFGMVMWMIVSIDLWMLIPLHIILGIICLGAFVLRGGLEVLGGKTARKTAGFGVGITVYSGLFIGILVLVNYVASRHEWLHFDSTAEKVYTLAPQTTMLLEKLESKIVMRGFFLGGRLEPQVDDLIKRITRHSDKVKWELIDPEKKPELAEKYGVNESETIHFAFAQGDSERESKIVREINEQEIVNAILKLTRGGTKSVYYVKGHGEPDLANSSEDGYLFLKESIQGENLLLKELSLSETGTVPADASAIILAAPEKDLLPAEFAAIKQYLESGGNAVLLNEPRRSQDIAKLVAPFGINVGNDVIVDQVVRLFAGPGLGVQPMVTNYGEHPITKNFSQGTMFSIASSVVPAPNPPSGVKITPLASTSEQSWAEHDLPRIFADQPEAVLDDKDIKGPVPLAVAYEALDETASNSASDGEKTQDSAPSRKRIVVVGDADFVTNANLRQLFNRDFFLNCLNWAVGEEEQVTIRAKSLKESTEGISVEQFGAMFLLTGVLLPEALLLGGLRLWWSRKG